MVRNPFWLDPMRERLEAREIIQVERGGGCNRQRYAVHHDGVACSNPLKHGERTAARQHERLRDDLEPVDRPIAFENLGVVLRSQSETEAEKRRLAAA